MIISRQADWAAGVGSRGTFLDADWDGDSDEDGMDECCSIRDVMRRIWDSMIVGPLERGVGAFDVSF